MLTYLVISSKEKSGRRRRNIHKLRKARASEKNTERWKSGNEDDPLDSFGNN